jgi:hypothetical protein
LTEVNGCKPPSGRRWNKKKKKVEIEGTEEKKKNIFYTFIPPVWLQFQTAADITHWVALSSFTISFPIPKIWIYLDTKSSIV